MKSVSRGIIALLLVSAILLFSDLQNRTARKKDHPNRTYKMAMVQYMDNPNSEDCDKGIRKALSDKNLQENINFTLKVYNAQGDISTLNSIAGTLANETWDLVFAISTPTIQLLSKKLPDTKIVFTNVGDPLIAGLGKTFEEHLPNITGISTMSDFDGLLRLVRSIHPGIKRIGTVFTPAEINAVSYKDHLAEAGKKIGVELIAAPANTATEVLDAAHSLVSQQIEAFCQISDNLTGSSCSAILKVAAASKVPYYGFVTQQLPQGAIAVCARDYFQAGYEAGEMAVEVLAGKSPATIPYRYVSKTEYRINPDHAQRYNVTIPERVYSEFPEIKVIKTTK